MSAEENAAENTAGTPRAFAYGALAETYDRARPSYPEDAATWLVGASPQRVLELGAGTGKLTELLVAAGHDVLAIDPAPEMLALLAVRVPQASTAVGTAERIPAPSQSFDVVVCAESFHWFNHPVALDEIARVLRPEGTLAMVWNFRDEGIPWVKRLGRIISPETAQDLLDPVHSSPLFDEVDETEFRFWQNLRKDGLLDLVRTRSSIASMPEAERTEILERVGALYDDYGRGHDGMKLPYLTRCYRTQVLEPPPAPLVVEPIHDLDATQPVAQPELAAPGSAAPPASPPEDTGTVLIDFK
jgi:ubiquinone/menaquinone biosynthesis C-methylase UbiE